MSTDITSLLDGMRGQEYIDTIRSIQAEARRRGQHLVCGGQGCTAPAAWIGMQRCGEPGPPVCQQHWQRQQDWMATAAQLGQPYCRHCGDDTDASHIYVASIDSEGPTK